MLGPRFRGDERKIDLTYTMRIATDRHAECAPLLLEAGLTVDEAALPTGNDALDRVLRDWLLKSR